MQLVFILTSADFEYLFNYVSANGQNQVYTFTKEADSFLSLTLPNVFLAFHSTFQDEMVIKPRDNTIMLTKMNTILIFSFKTGWFFFYQDQTF